MLTLKFKIKNKINVTKICENYSYMFRKLFCNFELSKDKNFEKELREKFNLDSWIFQSCRVDVEAKLKQVKTACDKRLLLLSQLEKDLLKPQTKRNIYRIHNKIRSIKNDKGTVIFGGKKNLQKMSFLSNTNPAEAEIWRKKYRENRVLPINIIGEELKKSNRKFDFNLDKKQLTFKPELSVKIPITAPWVGAQ